MELFEYTAKALSEMQKEGKCSAVEIAQSVFDRLESLEEAVGAYLTVTKDTAMEKAAEVDRKRAAGDPLSPLAGIPVGIKDNICTKGVRTTCASRMLENFIPPYDATVMTKLKAADIVMTGKLNMDEFAMGSSCENSYFKVTRNPRNLFFVAGGSSGGSAAAVCAGQAVLALGSDTGGSIRQPSAYCGTVGLKPTYGAVSRYGLVAFASSLDQIGPIGRSVADVAMLYDTICGRDPMDATSVAISHENCMSALGGDIAGLRIGIPKEYFEIGVKDKVKRAVMEAVKELEKCGAVIQEVSLPSTPYALSAYYIISSAEASSNLARYDGVKYGYRSENAGDLLEMYENTRSEGFGKEVKRRIMLGTFVLSSGYFDAYYKRAKLLQNRIRSEFDAVFSDVDLLITPTTPAPAFMVGQNVNDPLQMYAADVCTVPINIAGLPAVSVPCGRDIDKLPIGMQIIGPHFSEARILRLADRYEQILNGFGRLPKYFD